MTDFSIASRNVNKAFLYITDFRASLNEGDIESLTRLSYVMKICPH